MAESNTLFYLIDQQEITNVKNTIKDPTDEEIDLHTDPSTIVEQPEGGLSRLTCPFCKSISKDAIQDSNCGHCFCRSCAKKNLPDQAECPAPKCGETFQAKELSKYYRSEFDSLTVACEDCKQVYAFNQTIDHRKRCSIKLTPCIYDCGDGKLYKGLEKHLSHVANECLNAKVICNRCKT